jgi:hypothetical protein
VRELAFEEAIEKCERDLYRLKGRKGVLIEQKMAKAKRKLEEA